MDRATFRGGQTETAAEGYSGSCYSLFLIVELKRGSGYRDKNYSVFQVPWFSFACA